MGFRVNYVTSGENIFRKIAGLQSLSINCCVHEIISYGRFNSLQSIPNRHFSKLTERFIYLLRFFLSTYIYIYLQNTHTYAKGIGIRLGLSLPSPVGITITVHCTN